MNELIKLSILFFSLKKLENNPLVFKTQPRPVQTPRPLAGNSITESLDYYYPGSLDKNINTPPTELQKPLPQAWVKLYHKF